MPGGSDRPSDLEVQGVSEAEWEALYEALGIHA